ncbi:HTH-type transcriptional regulator RutR [Marinomonas mediterranea]|jgi:transcriptional regulator, TetR family|uniref:Transcriptional regulator, TetR family n=1 Tax=Marinomonas mediterranea (strain ATCC 700492 / JCM 21426 / NBRC 103028 / MMB-1) TaxID=717774 RepID=F2JWG0_MARM1|nr:HTH-type transcriptional regulator RutR [Marinomonas mediterranea]ADZ90633.1 transcriptional regulator, TetR family [Marinomonas mediterranea MMB-1]WCN08675.1 HTH-type transcriptional regulator RutR [Marinomonas mediterranea]WCN12730.1 HTH-type transcriptional regulator RutR [Marinomonas mediterranea]WCN16803.1 HTH-type transcriptional regulator RutR [Marinomonas mediterranea MMB-1]
MSSDNVTPDTEKEKSPRTYSASTQRRRSAAKQDKQNKIMEAALELFSRSGLGGTSIDQVAELADVSKSNLLYHFNSKEQLYIEVIKHVLDVWVTPLEGFSEDQDPIEAISGYIKVKLEMSRDNPEESRLFCMEVVHGAPLLSSELKKPLHDLVEAKAAVIHAWIKAGKMQKVDPYHLLFTIWATTQHYADFAVQIEAITGRNLNNKAFFNETLATLYQLILKGIEITDRE